MNPDLEINIQANYAAKSEFLKKRFDDGLFEQSHPILHVNIRFEG